MPWWALLALATFAFVAVRGLREGIAVRDPAWVVTAEAVGDGLLLVLAVSYWLGPSALGLKPAAPLMLVTAIALSIFTMIRELTSITASLGEKVAAAFMLATVWALPLYWAAMFAILGQTAG